ncbi:type II toxin-antitoxin system VapC family toxin [Moraxella equi]|uniref:Ribonuclease VapC22 n=2 Tax=Moraxella equi TaxID=60442 RepID=A0A378QRH5_9GAMM|nr:type II toxin-antitoxin system VapC family toxin [Moraxella equi]OPH38010.1 twitching motility protein PilT [Moraxella equi]STZ03506.1 Ribonuclease VapC22 [Moraxella equi]
MNIIMDTHIFYWYVNQIDDRLPKSIKNQLDNADRLFVSSATCFEMSWLVQKGRIELNIPYLTWFDRVQNYTDIEFLDITPQIAHVATALPEHHKDPMDRLIIATSIIYECYLASVDTKFPLYNELKGRLIS